MSSVKYEGQRISHEAQKAGNAFYDAFKNFFKNWKEPAAVSEFVEKAPSKWTAIPRASARAGAWVVEQPFAVVMKPVSWILKSVGGFYTKFPRLAPIATVVGAAVGIGSYFSRGKAANLQNEFQAQAAAANIAPQQSYMNSASQADVDARIAADRASQAAPGGASHAATVTAAREQVKAPGTLDVSAL